EEEAIRGLETGAMALANRLDSAVDERAARILDGGLNVVLCGRPNAGKSSLLNALIGEERAIVTDIPGTTRDLVTSTLQIAGLSVHLTDTAGLHEAQDAVERIGIDRAEKAIAQADAAILLIDRSRPLAEQRFALNHYPQQTVIALTKGDLPPLFSEKEAAALYPGRTIFAISSVTGEGLQPLKDWIAAQAGDPENLVITQPRHVHAAQQASQSLRRALESLQAGQPLDMCAVDLHDALRALGEITGEQVDEKLLDKIFADFCVGK
ncbi:MAG: 50S ribosome-binding GTPase, partial [Clostridia bacterium]|nr:50S ribosome-binding GTPase [Clostridia bacterium]